MPLLLKKRIYVDAINWGLFAGGKFESRGWSSFFSRPIARDVLKYYEDKSHGMERIEVRSCSGNAHLGHVHWRSRAVGRLP